MSWFRAKMRSALYLPSFAMGGGLIGMTFAIIGFEGGGSVADGWLLGAAIGATGGLIGILLSDTLFSSSSVGELQDLLTGAGLEVVDRPVVILRPDCSVLFGNLRFREMTGMTAEELRGLSFGNLKWRGEDGRTLDSTPWGEVAEAGVGLATEYLLLPSLGEPDECETLDDRSSRVRSNETVRQIHCRVTCQPLPDESGRLAGLFVAFEPISGPTVHALDFKPVRHEALLKLSHEIRSPISALLGHAEWLRNEPSIRDVEQQKQLDIIHDSGTQVLELVSRILDHSDLDRERKQIEFEECSPFSILKEIEGLFQLQAAQKGLGLELVILGELPLLIRTEAVGLRQLLTNLVENAIKFTDAGQVVIRVQMLTRSQVEYLEIVVTDSGVGIPPDRIDAIFEPFVQGTSDREGQRHGVGLGLAICRDLATRLKLQLDVRSEQGVGSEFAVRLKPRIPAWTARLNQREFDALQGSKSSAEKRIPSQALAGKKILVVDDDLAHRKLFTLYLDRMGALSREVKSGEEAIEIVQRERFDLVLMDIQMPGPSGGETLLALRESGFLNPVIAVTACVESLLRCSEGAFAFAGWLRKPIQSFDLEAVIRECLGPNPSSNAALGRRYQIGHSSHSSKHRPNPPNMGLPKAALSQGSMGARSMQAIHSSLPTEEAGFAEIVSLFGKTLRIKLDEIDHSSREYDREQLHQFAHWLKGTSGACGFHDFLRPALELERAVLAGRRLSLVGAIRDIQNLAEAVMVPALVE